MPIPVPLDRDVQNAVAAINKTTAMTKPNEPPEYRFVAVGDQVVEAVLETAKAQLNKAENNFKAAEQVAEDIRQRIKHVWDLLQGAEKELEEYGHNILDMSEKIARKKGNSK
jgi:hypothetical protein